MTDSWATTGGRENKDRKTEECGLVERRSEQESVTSFSLTETVFEPSESFGSEDGESAVLECFGEAEQDGPEDDFGSWADGKQRLREGKDIERYAEQEYDDPGAEREGAEPSPELRECLSQGIGK